MGHDAASPDRLRPHEGLSRQAVVEAATALVAEGGLASLSMRRIAERLGVWPTAVYHYVDSREQLADLVVDRVIAGVTLPDEGLDPRDWLRELSWTLRREALAHPGVVDRILDRGPLGPAGLALMDAAGRCLQRLGWNGIDLAQAYNFFFTWLAGAVRKTERFYARGREGYAPFMAQLEHADPRALPAVAVMREGMATMPDDPDAVFTWSLEAAVDAVDARQGARADPQGAFAEGSVQGKPLRVRGTETPRQRAPS